MDPDLAEPAAVCRTLAAIRQRAPLVHNITNVVVANVTANALLAIGASPAMVQAEEEVGEFARIADALVVNLGTVTAERAVAMRIAVAAAGEAGDALGARSGRGRRDRLSHAARRGTDPPGGRRRFAATPRKSSAWRALAGPGGASTAAPDPNPPSRPRGNSPARPARPSR